jgi:hypothetical protein
MLGAVVAGHTVLLVELLRELVVTVAVVVLALQLLAALDLQIRVLVVAVVVHLLQVLG